MVALREVARHPVQKAARPAAEKVTQRPYWMGGILLLILGAVGFYWLYPEVRRYIKIERM